MEKYIKDGIIFSNPLIIKKKNNYISDSAFGNDNNQPIEPSYNEVAIYNPTEEQLLEAGYTKYIKTLEDYKTDKVNEISDYDNSDNVNMFSLKGNSIWLDFTERARIKTSIDAYENQGLTTMTEWYNDTEYTYSLTDWRNMLSKLEVYAIEASNVTDKHIADIKSFTTINDIVNYDITKDYPTKLILP